MPTNPSNLTPEQIKLLQQQNDLYRKQLDMQAEGYSLSSSYLESLKEILGIRSRTSVSDNNILTTTKMRSEMDDVADKRNAKYLGITNNGQRSLHKFLCENGHEFKLQASDINRGRWCWDCSLSTFSIPRNE